ncbi:MAG: hypothetical protein V1487_02755, partial [bacterium]
TGFLVILIFGVAGFYIFRGAGSLVSRLRPTPTPIVTPSPNPLDLPSPSYSPTPIPSSKPTKTIVPTTTTTTTTTTSHLLLTLIKTSECKSYLTEIKDIQGPLTLRYSLKDGYKAAVTAWKQNGEELISQREISGTGELKRIEGLTYLKLQSQPAQCEATSDTWLTITAER